ncbi:MAG: peptide chain release factor N(5)-glutamine methyltransferase, partial [Candidatus Binatia bacterium]
MALDGTVALNGRGVTMAQAAREGASLLSQAGIESSALDAEILLRHVLDFEGEQLYLNNDGPLGEHDQARYRQLLQQRALGKPVAYITGNKEFWSLGLLVTPDVLIPRPETELLVEV